MSKTVSYIFLTLSIFLFLTYKIEAVWNLPAVPISSTYSNNSQIKVDKAGNAVAIWQEYDGSNTIIMGSTFSVCSGWKSPVPLSLPCQNSTDHQIAVDTNGNAVAVWVRSNAANTVIQGAVLTFGAPKWRPTKNLSKDGENASVPQVAVDPKGNAVAVWQKIDTITGKNVTQAATLAFGQLNWRATSDISLNTQDTSLPQIAVDQHGNAISIWQNDTLKTVEAAILAFGSHLWTKTVITSESPTGSPHVAVDAAGNAVAIWEKYNGTNIAIESARLGFGSVKWTAPVFVSSTNITAYALTSQLAVDPAGNAVAIWRTNMGPANFIESATLPFGATKWSSTTILTKPGDECFDPQIAVDSAGNAIAIWNTRFGDNILQTAMRTFGGTWSSPTNLSDPNLNQILNFPQISMNSSGYAVANWTNETLTQIQATTWQPAVTSANVHPNRD